MKVKYSTSILAIALALLSSCGKEEATDALRGEQAVVVKMGLTATKSVLPQENEAAVTAATASYYELGYKVGESELGSDGYFHPTLYSGHSYNVYVAANMPGFSFPMMESDLGGITYTLPESFSFQTLNGSIPMSGYEDNFTPSDNDDGLTITVTRLFARLEITVDRQSLADYGFSDASLSVKNINRRMLPFTRGFSSKALSAGDIAADGDLADEEDGKWIVYVPENMQGSCEGIGSAEDKVPSRTDNPSLCTYVELTASISKTDKTKAGTAKYRFYLGENSTTDFNVRKNHSYTATVIPTVSGLDIQDWWKVEPELKTLRFSTGDIIYDNTLPTNPNSVTLYYGPVDGSGNLISYSAADDSWNDGEILFSVNGTACTTLTQLRSALSSKGISLRYYPATDPSAFTFSPTSTSTGTVIEVSNSSGTLSAQIRVKANLQHSIRSVSLSFSPDELDKDSGLWSTPRLAITWDTGGVSYYSTSNCQYITRTAVLSNGSWGIAYDDQWDGGTLSADDLEADFGSFHGRFSKENWYGVEVRCPVTRQTFRAEAAVLLTGITSGGSSGGDSGGVGGDPYI